MDRIKQIAAVVLIASTALPGASLAQSDTYTAAIRSGGCDERGELLTDLTPPARPEGEPVGRTDAITAAQSRSSLPTPLRDIAAGNWSLFVTNAENPSVDVACGALGGVFDASGSLVVGLSPVDGSSISGIAYLSPSATGTNISLFIAPDQPDDLVASESAQGAETAKTPEALDTEDIIATAEAAPTPTPVAGTSQTSAVPVGTPLIHDNLQVTIDSAYYDYSFANAIPRGGYKVLILGVTLQNIGAEGNERYSAANFSGKDADTGVDYGAVTLDNVGVLLADGDLQPGQYVSGTVLIEVQETASRVYVKYDPVMFDTNDLYWLVQ